MNCNDIRPLISAYYDGEATPEEYSRVESHLVGCEACSHALAEYRAIGSGMRALAEPIPPSGLRRDVWRAIEARPSTATPGRAVLAAPRSKVQSPKSPASRPANPLATKFGKGWGGAIPVMGLTVAALVLFVAAILITRNISSTQAAARLDASPTYVEPVRVQFSKDVKADEARQNTSVRRVEAGASAAITNIVKSYSLSTRILAISPPGGKWVAGANYEIDIDAPNIHLNIVSGILAPEPITLTFSLPALTATPTSTPTSTSTVKPTHTAEPTAIAQVIHAANTPEPVSTLPTRAIIDVTSTSIPGATSTSTSTPARTVEPSATPTATPTNEAGQDPTTTPGHKGTQTPGPGTTATPGASTPIPACSSTPVSGFGKLWNGNPVVRNGLGCPEESESAILAATQQHFQGGYMFWREDTHVILVFLNGASDGGTWVSYTDTWRESDPTPVPSTPPQGYYEPVRGFGKVWHADPGLRQRLGWATDQEAAITGAWQPFAHGNTLWTSDRYIRVLYDDFTWSGFVDTYATPTPVANRPVGE